MADLEVFQGEYNGVVFGPNTPYHLVSNMTIAAAQTKSQDVPIPRGDGSFAARDFVAGRDIILNFMVYADEGHLSSEVAQEALLNAFTITGGRFAAQEGSWLRFRTRTGVYRLWADAGRYSAPQSHESAKSGGYPVTVLLNLADPHSYTDQQELYTVYGNALGGSSGWELEGDLPFDLSGPQPTANPVVFFQVGNGVAYPRLDIYNGDASAIDGFVVTEQNTGQTVTVKDTISPGQTFSMDFANLVRGLPGPHITNEGINRYSFWEPTRAPLGFPNGENRVAFTPLMADVPTIIDAIRCTITFRHTFD